MPDSLALPGRTPRATPPDFATAVLADARPLAEVVRDHARACSEAFLVVPTIAQYAGCIDPRTQPAAAHEAAYHVLVAVREARHEVLEELAARHPRWEPALRRACLAVDALGGPELDLELPDAVGPVLADGIPRFRIGERLTAGSHGAVVAATDAAAAPGADPRCIVKFIAAAAPGDEPWAREAATARTLGHACRVDVRAHGRAGPALGYIVSERVRGRSLAALAAIEARPTLDQLGPAVAELARGVADLHDAGHAHGDISPTNVLLDDDGVLRLVDFGSSRAATPEAVSADVRRLALLVEWLACGHAQVDAVHGPRAGGPGWARAQRSVPLPPRAFADALEHGVRRARTVRALAGIAVVGVAIWLLGLAVA